MNTRSFIFFTRILARAQIISLTSESFFIEVLSVTILETTKTTRSRWGNLLGFYRSQFWRLQKLGRDHNTKRTRFIGHNFGDYKNCGRHHIFPIIVLSVTILETTKTASFTFKTYYAFYRSQFWRLQKRIAVIMLNCKGFIGHNFGDYKNRSSLKHLEIISFIGHNFGDYKNLKWYQLITP